MLKGFFGEAEVRVILGRWTEEGIDRALDKARASEDAGARIALLSEQFLGTPYCERTLIGGPGIPEVLVINLSGVDCFTFIDYVEAMRLSPSIGQFTARLACVRYRGGKVAFSFRNHFLTDWSSYNREFVEDVTALVGSCRAISVTKRLNLKADGSPYVTGIAPVERVVTHLPADAIDVAKLSALCRGDYLGIYSPLPGLDVSHVGIAVIRADGEVMLRHASLSKGAVVDEPLRGYFANKPGLVVLRAKGKQQDIPK